MESLALTVLVAIVAGVGLKPHIVLPERHAPDRQRDMTGAMMRHQQAWRPT